MPSRCHMDDLLRVFALIIDDIYYYSLECNRQLCLNWLQPWWEEMLLKSGKDHRTGRIDLVAHTCNYSIEEEKAGGS